MYTGGMESVDVIEDIFNARVILASKAYSIWRSIVGGRADVAMGYGQQVEAELKSAVVRSGMWQQLNDAELAELHEHARHMDLELTADLLRTWATTPDLIVPVEVVSDLPYVAHMIGSLVLWAMDLPYAVGNHAPLDFGEPQKYLAEIMVAIPGAVHALLADLPNAQPAEIPWAFSEIIDF